MTDEQAAERGRLAEDVLNNSVYTSSYALIESEFMALWRASRDKDEREDIHRALVMLDKARNVLETAMREGKIAAAEIQRKQSLAQRIAGRVRA
jgi:hypothetical protein